jgi:hypothetical protein
VEASSADFSRGSTVLAGVKGSSDVGTGAPGDRSGAGALSSAVLGEIAGAAVDCGSSDEVVDVAFAGVSRCSIAWKVPTSSARWAPKSPLENAKAALALRRSAETAVATTTVRFRVMAATVENPK